MSRNPTPAEIRRAMVNLSAPNQSTKWFDRQTVLEEILTAARKVYGHSAACGTQHGTSKCDCGLAALRDKIVAYDGLGKR